MFVDLSNVDPRIIAAIIASGGAITVKIIEKLVEKWIRDRSESFNEAERIRTELRNEVHRLRDENTRYRDDIDEWREKHWADQSKIQDLETAVQNLESEIKFRDDK